MASSEAFPMSQGSDALASSSPPLQPGSPGWFAVWLFHDPATPRMFLVAVLVEIFHQRPAHGLALAQVIEAQGKGRVGPYTRDLAETRAALAQQWARQEGHPLPVRVGHF